MSRILLYWIIIIVQISLLNGQSSGEKIDSPPQIPEGFKTREEVIAAFRSGKLKVINGNLPVPKNVLVTKNLEYGKVGSTSLKLDLYQPKHLSKASPALILIHGGSWVSGSKEHYHYYGLKFAEKGYVTATVSYRLSGEAPFPAAVQDVKGAVRWMKAHAKKYSIDPERIGVMGGSAGGHLALLLAYTSGIPQLEGDSGYPEFSSKVAAVVDIYGPADLTLIGIRYAKVVQKFMGKKYQEDPASYELASPINHVKKNQPPTLILHGTIDRIVPVQQSDFLASKLKEVGAIYQYDRLKGWPHGMDLVEAINDRCFWMMVQFYDKHLKKALRSEQTEKSSKF